MSDASGGLRKGEKRRIIGFAKADGPITLSNAPSPVCTLYNETGQPVGAEGQPVTGTDQPTEAMVRAWLYVDSSTLPSGHYTLTFSLTVLDQGGNSTEVEASVDFEVLDEPHLPKAAQIARNRLMQTEATLPDLALYPEMDLLVRRLQIRYPCMGLIVSLTGDDRASAEEAIGLLVAVRLRPVTSRNSATGELVSVKLVQQQFTFQPGPKQNRSPEQTWFEEAYQALGQISCIRAMYLTAASAFCPFVLSGPTRTAKAGGLHETLMSGLVRLLTDDWNADTDSQNGVGV